MELNDVMDNLHDPQRLAEMYREDPQSFEELKLKYPTWKFMANLYNRSLIPTLKQLGVPV